MAYVTGDFLGLTAEDYETLSNDYPELVNSNYFIEVQAGNGTFYQFTGDELEYLDEVSGAFELTFFTYILSTNSVYGF